MNRGLVLSLGSSIAQAENRDPLCTSSRVFKCNARSSREIVGADGASSSTLKIGHQSLQSWTLLHLIFCHLLHPLSLRFSLSSCLHPQMHLSALPRRQPVLPFLGQFLIRALLFFNPPRLFYSFPITLVISCGISHDVNWLCLL
jgi:hypothetical protein